RSSSPAPTTGPASARTRSRPSRPPRRPPPVAPPPRSDPPATVAPGTGSRRRCTPQDPGGDRDQAVVRGQDAGRTAMGTLVYFSSVSENTKRFVEKLGVPAHRIPLRPTDDPLVMDEEFVLMTPTYGGGNGRGAVPK